MESSEEKNPVSLINEYCQFKKIDLFFKVINEEGEPHAKRFTVSCTVEDFVTTGSGRSVKQGKTNSAQSMIEMLQKEGLLSPELLQDKGKKTSFTNIKSSLLKKKIEDNPVGCLQEYCMAKQIPLPEYTDVMTDRGFKTSCKVNDITCEGCGRQKKLAKTDAAMKMCEIIFKKLLNDDIQTQFNGINSKAEENIEANDEGLKNGDSEEFNDSLHKLSVK